MKKITFLAMLLFGTLVYSQVGLNTQDPKATFDITAKYANGNNPATDGLLIPRVDRERAESMVSPPLSTLVYVNDISTGSAIGKAVNITSTGFYYFDGNVWIYADSDINIYKNNGTVTDNRTVSLTNKTISFTGTAANAFSVDGSTFSVNAANNRVGVNTIDPHAILSVGNNRPGGLTDAFSAGINNCGASCGQGTARNITLYNQNGTNPVFASIDFIPSNKPDRPSGSIIKGIDRDTLNNYAGLQFITRNDVDLAARMTIRSKGNIGIGTEAPKESAILDLTSTTQGFLPPRMTTAQRDAIVNKVAGLTIYNTSLNCMQYWNSQIWKGDCDTTSPPGTITTLECNTATQSGTLTSGAIASNVSVSIHYTGGNGNSHTGQTVNSTGVAGLTATLAPGNFSNGSGDLVYTISGTPSSGGTASFAINIGGQSCNIQVNVQNAGGAISSLNCSGATHNGTLTSGTLASGVSSQINYTGGNGGSYSAQSITSTGVAGLTATLAAGNFANGNGSLTYTITGTPSSAGTASFAINIGGQSCTFTRNVDAAGGAISSLNCNGATHNGTLTSGTLASGVSSQINYTGGNGGSYSAQSITSTGVTGLTATLSAGNFANGNGSLTYTITGTPSSAGTASFAINIGGQSCTFTRNVDAAGGAISALNCSSRVVAGEDIFPNSPVNNVTITVPYTGGNGGSYSAQSIPSTGVTGLTATLSAGNFANGNGNLVFHVSGTVTTEGNAVFNINIGGQNCSVTVAIDQFSNYSCNAIGKFGNPDYTRNYVVCVNNNADTAAYCMSHPEKCNAGSTITGKFPYKFECPQGTVWKPSGTNDGHCQYP